MESSNREDEVVLSIIPDLSQVPLSRVTSTFDERMLVRFSSAAAEENIVAFNSSI
jgi:hypothetical protein